MSGFSAPRGAALIGVALALVIGGAPAARAELLAEMRVASIEPLALTEAITESPPDRVKAIVDLSDQTMTVYVGDRVEHVFKVSTGRGANWTPTGEWSAKWLSPKHRSRKYNNAPMPWAVFFHRGYAVHGTTDVKRLGRPASHGCIRLHPDNAKLFYALVKTKGKENTLISIVR